ncbi:MAG: hypothetical protein COS84_05705 [Armatimonadetes bacterium CG07_land_8_20_14_0_80_40_9]|nr:MAG: hypothetical protein COS84_05705 [Armatimonadetes bacterium CG07_land_8_20_14_0_80_40_9]
MNKKLFGFPFILKTTLIKDLAKILLVLLASLVLAIIINLFHPMKLPLWLGEVNRPGIPKEIWEKIDFTNAKDAFERSKAPGVILLDVRDKKDYLKNRIPNAINLPYYEFERFYRFFADKVPKDRQILIYCYGTQCGLSARVAKRLIVLGFTNLTVIQGGIKAWKKVNLPIDEKPISENAEKSGR